MWRGRGRISWLGRDLGLKEELTNLSIRLSNVRCPPDQMFLRSQFPPHTRRQPHAKPAQVPQARHIARPVPLQPRPQKLRRTNSTNAHIADTRNHPHRPPVPHHHSDLRVRKREGIVSQYPRNRPACPNQRHIAPRVRCRMQQPPSHLRYEKQERESCSPMWSST